MDGIQGAESGREWVLFVTKLPRQAHAVQRAEALRPRETACHGFLDTSPFQERIGFTEDASQDDG